MSGRKGASVSRLVIRSALITLIILTQLFAGCFGSDEKAQPDTIPWDENYIYIDDPLGHEDARDFVVGDIFANQTWGNASWAVFGNEHGGNCCEHYLAATKEGWIVNFGGEYPTWT
ncbi:MAG: hypothetical protein QF544_02250, partial [Candidatus Thalassarchaeaceae archaeon]|nr:hypothetical protein [Candidatus Thalassarchaeaceae archaeon]